MSHMPPRLVVLLAHGSPDPRSARAVRRAADALTERTGTAVTSAFLDHDRPRLADVVAGAPEEIAVLPLLLSAAFHARVDVPAAVAALGRPVTLLDPLGHPPTVLDPLLLRATGPVVVVAAGTRIEQERNAFAHAVAQASRRTGVAATEAFATGSGPSVPEALKPGTVVVPWLLAPGRLLDSVLECSAGHRVIGGGLLAEASMQAVLAERVVDWMESGRLLVG